VVDVIDAVLGALRGAWRSIGAAFWEVFELVTFPFLRRN
jgi:hypothetical protein